MKKVITSVLVISILLVASIIVPIINNTKVYAATKKEGDAYNIVFFKYNNENVMLPLKISDEELKVGIDNNQDGKVDDEYNFSNKKIKPQILESSYFDVYINDQKIKSPIKIFEGTDVYNKNLNNKEKEEILQLEDLNPMLILGIQGEVSSTDITYEMDYASLEWSLPVTINEYGQLASSPWISYSTPTKSQKEFLDENGYEKMTGEFILDEGMIDGLNNRFNPKRLDIYIPAYLLDKTLYDLPEVNGRAGSTLDTQTFSIDVDGGSKNVEYIDLSDIVYINPLCGDAGDIDYDQTETECSDETINDFVKFKWSIPQDIWIEEFSGRVYLNGDEQPTVLGNDKESLELIDKGAVDKADSLSRLTDYGLEEAFPLNTEMLSIVLNDNTLKDPIIVINHGFGKKDPTGDSVEMHVSEIGDDNSAKAISRGYNSGSKYIFQRVKLSYSEEKALEEGSVTKSGGSTNCPSGIEEDCIFFFEGEGENLETTKEHYDDRFDMYASDFTQKNTEVVPVKEIKTCRDLESIGRGENYPGASHYEAWEITDNYELTDNINCYETTKKGSIYDDNLEDKVADGFEPIGLGADGKITRYEGTFNGNGYTIENLHMDHNYNNVGLFSSLGATGEIKNVNFSNPNIQISSSSKDSAYAGVVAGENYGKISNVSVEGAKNVLVANDSKISITDGESFSKVATGGIVGYNFGGEISNSHVIGDVGTVDSSGNLISTNVGGVSGFNSGRVINTYAKGYVSGKKNIGGLVGYNYSTVADSLVNGKVENSYTKSVVEGIQNVGGVVGTNAKNAVILNSYATSTFKRGKYEAGYVKGNENVGGVVGNASGKIKNTYSAVPVKGQENTGGLVGVNYADLRNSFAVANVQALKGEAGGLVGENAGSAGLVYNNYSYDTQKIMDYDGNQDFVSIDNLIGQDLAESKNNDIVIDKDLYSEAWYQNTTPKLGLGWKSNSTENAKDMDYIAPVMESSQACLPKIYNDSDLSGDFSGNDGTYVPGQDNDCFKIVENTNNVDLINYKIDAMNLDVELLVNIKYGYKSTRQGTVQIKDNNIVTPDIEIVYSMTEGNQIIKIPGEDLIADTDYNIIVKDEKDQIEFELKIHTPKQIVMDYDINEDGTISADEKDLVFSVIGDQVNQDTFISSTDAQNTPYEDTTYKNPTKTSNVYGIYELESIAYEDTYETDDWTDSDLTLVKYDHVIRPITGRYFIENKDKTTPAIDAKASDELTLSLDTKGGWSTDSGTDGIADKNDGFRPIGAHEDASKNLDFRGIITADSKDLGVIDGLYINTDVFGCTGMISLLQGNISNIGLSGSDTTKTYINGGTCTGTLVGFNKGKITNSYSKIGVSGKEEVGGLAGFNSGNITNSYSESGVLGSKMVGGISGGNVGNLDNSYATGSISGVSSLGGLVGYNNGGNVTNSYATGDVVGTASPIGGLVGENIGSIDSSYASGYVSGKEETGGLVGNNEETITNSYALGVVEGTYFTGGLVGTNKGEILGSYATGDVMGDKELGGLVGYGYPSSSIVDSHSTSNIVSNDTLGGLVGINAGDIDNSYAAGNISGKTAVGGLVGDNFAGTNITNSYATGDVIGDKYIGGLIGWNKGNIENSYALGNGSGKSQVGGLVGWNYPNGSIANSYATGDISGEEEIGGLVGWNKGAIKNSYATGYIKGKIGVGGLVGENYSDTKIENTYATGDVVGDGGVGGLVGIDYTGTNIINSYGYETQMITITQETDDTSDDIVTSINDTNIVGEELHTLPSDVYIAEYYDLIDINWYKNNIAGDGVGWNSTELEAEAGYDYTSPWIYGSDEDKDKTCHSHIYSTKNTGDYIPNQPCVPIEQMSLTSRILDYKIDAMTLDTQILINIIRNEKFSPKGTVVIQDDNLITPDVEFEYTMYIGEQIIKIPGGYLEANKDYTILLKDNAGDIDDSIKIHTPKQTTMDYDINEDGIIDASEEDLVFALIGDQINEDTFVSSLNTVDVPYTDTTYKNPTKTSNKFGVYELESIGYEDAYKTDDWSSSDLTIAKYDHIIRPITGRYLIEDADGVQKTPAIDGTVLEEGILLEDKYGGWSTDTNGDGTADKNDGFRPIGASDTSVEFTGVLTGNMTYGSLIKDLYINTDVFGCTGMISLLQGNVSNIGLESTEPEKVYINGGTCTGSLIGFNKGRVSNSYSKVAVSGEENVGGLTGVTNGYITNSYATGNVFGSRLLGGISGGISGGNIINSYATGNVYGENSLGGLLGYNNAGSVMNSYATGDIVGETESIGGLVGYSIGGNITNSYASGDVFGESKIGALIGENKGTITNSYAYETQEINKNQGTIDTTDDVNTAVDNSTIVGNDPRNTEFDPYIATYLNVIDSTWYSNKTVGSGLGWASTELDKKAGYDFTSPFIYGIDEDKDKICYPHIYNKENTGDYIPNQPCIQPEQLSLDTEILNYKIDAITLDTQLLLNVIRNPKTAPKGTLVIKDNKLSTPDVQIEYTLSVGKQIVTIPGEYLEADTDYEITLKDNQDQIDDTINLHTPEQLVMDYDINEDGIIDPATEKDLVFGVIGDYVNQDTFISSLNTEFEDTTYKNPTKTSNKYGVYELESIGYEDSNLEDDWSSSDLTLVKYDHIIRPITGNYVIEEDADKDLTTPAIDASETYETTLVLDTKGGFSTDTNDDGKANKNDGFRPIGYNKMEGYKRKFEGILTSTSKDYATISNLYINLETTNDVGLIGVLEGNISNVGLEVSDKEKLYIKGAENVGGLVGYNKGGKISQAYVDADVSGENDIGGLVGLNEGTIINTNSKGDIKGDYYVGGLVGENKAIIKDSYTTGNVEATEQAGGLVGWNCPLATIQNSYTTGEIVGTQDTGGLAGINGGNIEDSYTTGHVQGRISVGGLVGENYYGTNIINSYTLGNIDGVEQTGGLVGWNEGNIANSFATGYIKGENQTGGLVGWNYPTGSITNSYATGNVLGNGIRVRGEDVGGLVGWNKGTILNSYATGDVTGRTAVGGLVGENYTDTKLSDSYATGNVAGVGGVGGLVGYNYTGTNIINSYGYEAQKIINTNDTIEISDDTAVNIDNTNIIGEEYHTLPAEVYIATYDNLVDPTWYTTATTMGSGVNWNSTPFQSKSGYDYTSPWIYGVDEDESKICHPHIYDVDNTGQYIPNQPCVEIFLRKPTKETALENYKINAMTLDIQVMLNITSSFKSSEQGSVIVNEKTTGSQKAKITYNMDLGEQIVTIPGSSLDQDKDYEIIIKDDKDKEVDKIVVHTPKQIIYESKTYALLGDGVNTTTDVEDISTSDMIVPGSGSNLPSGTKTTPYYGIYELESIGYEEANVKTSISTSKADWTNTDLTLTKYDHIIRPLDGNYLIANNIEASASKNNTSIDNLGGFDTDGYRPIGQVIGSVGESSMKSTKPGDDVFHFTGTITGNVDEILKSSAENTYIKNIYINLPDVNYVGVVGYSEDSEIEDLGVVDPNITGRDYTGAIAGMMSGKEDGSENILKNVYALEARVDKKIDVLGKSYTGGLVGKMENGDIISDARFEGEIPGINLSSDKQPSNLPDRDGYKTFSTLDIKGGSLVGGIVGYFKGNEVKSSNKIENVYSKSYIEEALTAAGGIAGQVTNGIVRNVYYANKDEWGINLSQGAGGIVAVPAGNTLITNVHNESNIRGYDYVGGITGGTLSDVAQIEVTQAYNGGKVETVYQDVGSNIGGIMGISFSENTKIENVYNTGDVEVKENVAELAAAGGIIGRVADTGITIQNALNTGNVTIPIAYKASGAGGVVGQVADGLTFADIIIDNTYNGSTNYIRPKDEDIILSPPMYQEAYYSEFQTAPWWKEVLFERDPSIYGNWNIEAGDASVPSPDIDYADESKGDDLGPTNYANYPTIKESSKSTEVPEQPAKTMYSARKVPKPITDIVQKTLEILSPFCYKNC